MRLKSVCIYLINIHLVKDVVGIPPDMQWLCCSGKPLEDFVTMSFYIKPKDMVHMHLRLEGGMENALRLVDGTFGSGKVTT